MAARRQLRALYQEPDSLAKIERLLEYMPAPGGDECGARAREERRAEILAQIAKLKAERLKAERRWSEAPVTAAILATWFAAAAYASFHFFLR